MKAEKAALSAGLFVLRLAIIIFVIMGIIRVGEFAYTCGYNIVANEAVDIAPGRDVKVELTDRMSEQDVAKLMEEKGLVKDAFIFRLQLVLNKYEKKLTPGTYMLNTSMTPKELMKAISGEEAGEEEEEE